MKRSYSDLDQHTGDPPFAFGPAARGPRQPKQYQQQTEPSTGKIKACMQCGTTRTPQWREGPYGPKTLCNACGVKRVRAIKAQQQGKNPSQVAHPAGGSGKKKSSAAARTESIELATTLQLLAGNLDVGPPPAKRQARAGQVGGRGRKANSMQAAPNHVPEYDPFDPAAAAAMSAPALGSAVQKAIAAIAAKGSMGGESNPTDSGEEISWSPADHQTAGDAAAAAAAGGDAGSRRQRQQQQQQLQAAMAAAAAAHLQGLGAGTATGDADELLQAACLQSQQQMEASLAEGYGGAAAAAAAAGNDGSAAAGAAVDEEAAAVANLLSMSAASGDQEQQQPGSEMDLQPTSSAGKAAMREFVAQLAAGSAPTAGAAAASRSPGRRQGARASPSRAAASVRQRNAAAAAAAAAAVPEGLLEDEVMYLLGPGMAVMARYVAPEELLEVIKLNELASEAQRSKAAAEAAVEAVEQILRDKQAAALTAQATARNAMQRLHSYVGVLNSEHSLLLKAAQEQQQSASLASRLAAGGQVSGALSHLDLLAASLQQQQMQQVQNEVSVAAPEQQQQGMPMVNLAGLAAAAAAAATAADAAGAVKAEQAGGEVGVGLGAGGELVVEPLVVDGVGGDAGVGAVGGCVDAAMGGADAAVQAITAGHFVDALCAVDAAEPTELLPQQPQAEADTAAAVAQQELGPECHQLLHAAAVAAPAALPVAQLAAPAAAPVAVMPDVQIQDAQLLGSLQELAAIAGMFTGADNNGAAAATGGSPALI